MNEVGLDVPENAGVVSDEKYADITGLANPIDSFRDDAESINIKS